MFLVKLFDADALMKQAPTVTLKSGDAEVKISPQDKGHDTDDKAGDRLYSAPAVLEVAPVGAIRITVQSGKVTWETIAQLDPTEKDPALVFVLRKEGVISRTRTSELIRAAGEEAEPTPPPADKEQAPPPGGTKGKPPELAAGKGSKTGVAAISGGGGGTILPSKKTRSNALWFVLAAWGFTALGFVLATVIWLTGRKGAAPVKLKVSEVPPPVPPVRLDRASLPAALAGPLHEHRVVLLGSLPPGLEVAISCEDRKASAEGLVRAVEQEAARQGPPVALLIVEVDRLDGKASASERLAEIVGGRFPLWVVDGPEAWERWSSGDGEPTGT